MPHLEIHLRLSEPKSPEELERDDDNGVSYGAGWILGVKFWDDTETTMLTAEPVTIPAIAKIARSVKMRGKHEGDLMPWVETLTMRLLDAIEELIRRHEHAAELHRQSIAGLEKIHKHAMGKKAERHAQVDRAAQIAQSRAKAAREQLEAEFRQDLEEVPA